MRSITSFFYKHLRYFVLFIALLIPALCFGETWELAIQPYDKADLASGHKRAKAGDIVAVKPYPWSWERWS